MTTGDASWARVHHENGERGVRCVQYRAAVDDLAARYTAFAAECERLTALLAGFGDAEPPVGPGPDFLLPVGRAPVDSGFGPRIHPIFGEVRVHTGIDFAAGPGQPILASTAGTVVLVSSLDGYGTVTVLDHGGGVMTLYAHQAEVFVVTGDRVQRGEQIGLVGDTGLCTGPHLHFEVRVGGRPIDPSPWLCLDDGPSEAVVGQESP